MDVKAAFLIACLSALAITSTDAGIPSCCVKVRPNLNKHLLRKVERWHVQLSSGACDIPALILHIKNSKRLICAPMKLKAYLNRIKEQNKLRV